MSNLQNKISRFTEWWDGFSNKPNGFSGKKLTAFAVTISGICFPMVMYTISSFNSGKWELLPVILPTICTFVAGLFVANVWDKFKNKAPLDDLGTTNKSQDDK